MNKIIFYLPFAYFFTSRIDSPAKRLSWVAIYPIPIIMATLLFTGHSPLDTKGMSILLVMISGIFAIYSIYELGYLQNDALTISKETNPTIRLGPDSLSYVRENWIWILLFRLLLCGFFLGLIWHYGPSGFFYFLISLTLMATIFYIYNHVRSWVNVPLHFLLVCIRFCGPALLIMPDPVFLAYLILIFPLLNVLERGAEPRYGISYLQDSLISNQSSGRWTYYLVVGILWAAICYFSSVEFTTTLIFVYLFLYRLLSPYLLELATRT